MKDISILQPMTQVDKDKELLLELLKESRTLLMKRVAEQARKIVELTVSRNELLSEVNGIGNIAEMKEHITDMEENAKKMTTEIGTLRETLSHRTTDIEALHKSLEKLRSELDEKEMQYEVELRLNTELKIMVDYAKAQGMMFPRADKMKSFINQNSNEDSATAADAMAQMAKEADDFIDAVDDFITKRKKQKENK